jgi:hypothetical protein
MPAMKPIYFVPFISAFYAVGIGLLIFTLVSARRSAAAAHWPTTPAAVVRCSLDDTSDGDGGTTYQVKVDYDYAVGAREYSGSRVAFGYCSSGGWAAHNQIYQALRTAKTLRVRYDPADPSVSTLSYGLHRSIRFTLAFAVTWLAFVVGFTVIWWVAAQPDDVLVRNLVLK